MKFTSALSLCLAGAAAAKSVHNRHSERRRSESKAVEVEKRSSHGSFESLGHGISGFGISNTIIKEVIIIWVKPAGSQQKTTINTQIGGGQTAPPPPPGTQTQSAPGGVQTHSIVVGGPAGLVFTPDQIKANVNDMIVFTYLAQNHTVTQSAFETPCEPLAGGMDSGYQPNPNNTATPPPQVAMQVTTDKPLWFFCRQNGHCGKGMVFSVNPSAKNTHAIFQSKAIQQNGKGGGTGIVGGTPPPPAENAPPPPPPPAESSAAPPPPPAGGEAPSATVSVAPPGATDGVTMGSGTVLPDGACFCAVQCASIQVPAVDSQALGAFGGSLGSVPMNVGSF